jgi:DNA-binding NtrC family response regulator
MEREMILAALDRHQGDKGKAAAELGIAMKTIYNKLHQYEDPATTRAG